MDETRVFKSYSYSELLNGSDSVLAYDFAGAGYYEDLYAPVPRRAPQPQPRQREQEQEWIREEPEAFARRRAISRKGQGVSVFTVLGFAVAAVLLVMVLLAQIQMTAIADSAAGLENQILELRSEHNKLLAAYETTFSLAEVEDYAVNELGMQKPRADQIVYLDGLGTADRAVILQPQEQSMFALGIESVFDSLWSYFGGRP